MKTADVENIINTNNNENSEKLRQLKKKTYSQLFLAEIWF